MTNDNNENEQPATPYEFTRAGCTLACAVKVDDLDVVGVFLLDGAQLKVCWVAQELPATGDLIRPSAVGLPEGGLLSVVTRLWHNALFCMLAVEWAVEPGGDDLPEARPQTDEATSDQEEARDLARRWPWSLAPHEKARLWTLAIARRGVLSLDDDAAADLGAWLGRSTDDAIEIFREAWEAS